MAAKFAKLVLNLNLGYPYFSAAYISEHIDKPTTDRDELLQYKLTTQSSRNGIIARYCIVCLSFAYFIKSLTMPWAIFSEFNLKDPEENLVMLTNDTYRFSCLESNCTKLGRKDTDLTPVAGLLNLQQQQQHLAQTLFDYVPHFQLCHPILSKLHDSYQHFGSYGLILTSVLGFTVLFGGLLPLFVNYCKGSNFLIMFLVAPKITRQVVQQRAAQLLDQLAISRRNYQLLVKKSLLEFESNLAVDDHSSSRLRAAYGEIPLYIGSKTTIRHREQRATAANEYAFERLLLARPVCRQFQPTNVSQKHCHNLCRQSKSRLPSEWDSLRCQLIELEQEEEQQLKLFNRKGSSNSSNSSTSSDREGIATATAAEDCVTSMRSDWWRTRAIVYMNLLQFPMLGYLAFGFLLLYIVMHKWIQDKQNELNNIVEQTDNCSFWLSAANKGDTDDLNYIDLNDYQYEYSIFWSLVYMLQFMIAFVGYTSLLSVYLLTAEEITGWLCECKFELLLGTEFVKQLLASSSSSSGQFDSIASVNGDEPTTIKCKFNHNNQHQDYKRFNMERSIRCKFKPLAGLSFMINDCKLMGNDCLPTVSRLESVQAIEEYVTERIVCEQLCLCSAVDLLEKLHTSFRIFVEHVDSNEPLTSIMISSVNIFVYIFVIVNLAYVRAIKDFVLFPSMLLAISLMFTNSLIVLVSNFHAKATKLHTLIWSLIAITCKCSDIRIAHMRYLWLKQVQALDMDKGLALKAFGIRITYTGVIQLIIGSGTVIVFLLR